MVYVNEIQFNVYVNEHPFDFPMFINTSTIYPSIDINGDRKYV